jgi:hypothetical protein
MTRYALLNDLSRAHQLHLLREAHRARSTAGPRRLVELRTMLRCLWLSLA